MKHAKTNWSLSTTSIPISSWTANKLNVWGNDTSRMHSLHQLGQPNHVQIFLLYELDCFNHSMQMSAVFNSNLLIACVFVRACVRWFSSKGTRECRHYNRTTRNLVKLNRLRLIWQAGFHLFIQVGVRSTKKLDATSTGTGQQIDNESQVFQAIVLGVHLVGTQL